MCLQTAKYVSSYCCKCVLLLYMCPLSPRTYIAHTAIYCYICVFFLILLYICVLFLILLILLYTAVYVSSFLILLYMCPLSPRYVSSYCYMCPHTDISSVLILLYAGILSAIWYAKGVAQKILKESRRKEAEEALEAGRPICEHKRVDVVGDGDVILQMRIH